MAEPEFVLLDDEVVGGAPAIPLHRAGKRKPASSVLIDLHAHPRARRWVVRLVIVLIVGSAVGAAVVTFRKRRANVDHAADGPGIAAPRETLENRTAQ